MKQKILITGSCGFIFSNFIRKIIYEKKNYEVVSIDKVNTSSVLNNIYKNKNHSFYIGNIADEHLVNIIFEYERPDIVIHGAAESHVDVSLKDPNKFIHSNVLGTQVLVNAAIKWGVKKFVYTSSDEIYGQLENDQAPLWTETSPINPRNPYSASKMAGELFIKAAASSFGLNYCITRSCNNYGPRQTSDKYVPKIIKSIFNKQKMPVYGQGLQMRDWLYVDDNCAAILKIIEEGKNGEIYNISANQEFTNIEVLHKVCELMNVKIDDVVQFVDERPGHDFRYGIDSSKLKALGWAPTVKFKDGIKKTIDWYTLNKYLVK